MTGDNIRIYSSGYGHLDDFVIPFVDSVLQHEPVANLTIVDNGSPEPYPEQVLGMKVKRTDNLAILTSFSRAIKDDFDWLVLTDTDVICYGAFLKQIAGFDTRSIYGQQLFSNGDVRWFDSWLICIPREIWDAVGRPDEDFLLTGAFQDMDYCLRAQEQGYTLKLANLPFMHKGANTTHGSPDFWENREYNKRLIHKKHGLVLDKYDNHS